MEEKVTPSYSEEWQYLASKEAGTLKNGVRSILSFPLAVGVCILSPATCSLSDVDGDNIINLKILKDTDWIVNNGFDIEHSFTDKDIEKLEVLAVNLEESGDKDNAILLYKLGIQLGSTLCMTRLADILSEPPAFQDVRAAEKLYQKACIAGSATACHNLAILYNQLGKSDLYSRYMRLAKARGDEWQEDSEDEDL